MSDFDAASGSVWYEIEMMLSSTSGREKHTDLDEQGHWLVELIKQELTSIPLGGLAFGRILYWGQGVDRPSGNPLFEREVGPYVKPFHEQRLEGLVDLVRDLARLLDGPAPDGLKEVAEWTRGERSGRDLSEARRVLLWDPAKTTSSTARPPSCRRPRGPVPASRGCRRRSWCASASAQATP